MKITFYINSSENNRVDKELIFVTEMEGILRNPSSIVNPSIDVQFPQGIIEDLNIELVADNDEVVADNTDIVISIDDNIINCNYAYIQEFERYYFVNDIVFISNNIFRFNMSIDVLMSHKDKFRRLQGFITRNEYDFNSLIKDDLISYYYDKEIVERPLEKGVDVDTTFVSNENIYFKNYTLCVINDSSITDFTGIVTNRPSTKMPYVNSFTTGLYNQNSTYSTSALEMSYLTKKLIQEDNLKSFIISLNAFPFAPKTKPNSIWLRLGDTTLQEVIEGGQTIFEGVRVYKLNYPQGAFHTIADFTYTIENPSFLDYEPYTEYEIFIPYLSYIKISADRLINKRIKVSYAVNYQDGSAQVFVISNDDVIYTASCQIGVQIALNTTNAMEVKNNNISNGMNFGLGLVGGAISGAVGLSTGNPLAIGASILSLTKTTSSFIQNQNTNYEFGSGSLNSSHLSRFAYNEVYIKTTKLKPRSYDNDYFKLKGRPLNQIKFLSDVHGYTIIDDIHLEDFTATNQEKSLLIDYFKNGVIL